MSDTTRGVRLVLSREDMEAVVEISEKAVKGPYRHRPPGRVTHAGIYTPDNVWWIKSEIDPDTLAALASFMNAAPEMARALVALHKECDTLAAETRTCDYHDEVESVRIHFIKRVKHILGR